MSDEDNNAESAFISGAEKDLRRVKPAKAKTPQTPQTERDLMVDIIIRNVVGRGYLPIVTVDDKEVGRGSFYATPEEALATAKEHLLP